MALDVSDDPEQKFELALSLGDLSKAHIIAAEINNTHKWKSLGDVALKSWDVVLSEECFKMLVIWIRCF